MTTKEVPQWASPSEFSPSLPPLNSGMPQPPRIWMELKYVHEATGTSRPDSADPVFSGFRTRGTLRGNLLRKSHAFAVFNLCIRNRQLREERDRMAATSCVSTKHAREGDRTQCTFSPSSVSPSPAARRDPGSGHDPVGDMFRSFAPSQSFVISKQRNALVSPKGGRKSVGSQCADTRRRRAEPKRETVVAMVVPRYDSPQILRKGRVPNTAEVRKNRRLAYIREHDRECCYNFLNLKKVFCTPGKRDPAPKRQPPKGRVSVCSRIGTRNFNALGSYSQQKTRERRQAATALTEGSINMEVSAGGAAGSFIQFCD